MEDIEHEVELLSRMWGTSVHITYSDSFDEWLVSNTTDEGLPVGVEDETYRGDTLEEALEAAKNPDRSPERY